MKKIIISIFLIASITCSIWATDNVVQPKVNKQGNNWFFNGFQFDSYTSETHGIEGVVNVETQKILQEQTGTYSIIGHSQGGLRVLAYANYLKENYPEEYKNLESVITVSGIDKGLKALEGGVGPIKSRLYTDVDILWNGAKGIVAAVPFIDILIDSISAIEGLGAIAGKDLIVECLLSIIPSQYANYLRPALETENLDNLAEIRDMVPRSDFIKRWVADVKSERVRKLVGYDQRLVMHSKKVWIFTVWYPTIVTVPVYKEFEIQRDVPKFDPSLPVGYLVGNDKDTIKMADEATQKGISDVMSLYLGLGALSLPLHFAKCFTPWGLLTGSPIHMVNIGRGMDWVINVQRELNELMGSPEHDGLVAKESQFYPKEYHTNVLGNKKIGYVEVPLNHMMIAPGENVEFVLNGNKTTTQQIIDTMIQEAHK